MKQMEARAEEQRRAKQAADAEWQKQQRLREVQRAQVRALKLLSGSPGIEHSHAPKQGPYAAPPAAHCGTSPLYLCRQSWRGRRR